MRRHSRPRRDTARPAVPDARRRLLTDALDFVRAARSVAGVLRASLIGSLTTEKPVPKDAGLLVTVARDIDLARLATRGRRLMGRTQSMNLGADIFLADAAGGYLGRICLYRECFPRSACRALHCGLRQHLNDDLAVVALPPEPIRAPPIDLWPRVVRRVAVPADTEALLVRALEQDAPGPPGA